MLARWRAPASTLSSGESGRAPAPGRNCSPSVPGHARPGTHRPSGTPRSQRPGPGSGRPGVPSHPKPNRPAERLPQPLPRCLALGPRLGAGPPRRGVRHSPLLPAVARRRPVPSARLLTTAPRLPIRTAHAPSGAPPVLHASGRTGGIFFFRGGRHVVIDLRAYPRDPKKVLLSSSKTKLCDILEQVK